MDNHLKDKLQARASMIRKLAQTLPDGRARHALEAAAAEIEKLDEELARLLFATDHSGDDLESSPVH